MDLLSDDLCLDDLWLRGVAKRTGTGKYIGESAAVRIDGKGFVLVGWNGYIEVAWVGSNAVDNKTLIAVNAEIRNHPVELIGEELRGYMTGMKAI